MDVVSLIIGFVIGVVFLGIAIEIGTKKTTRSQPASKPTKSWHISEITNPKIMAEYLGDIEIPKDSKVIVNKYKDKKMLAGLNVKSNPDLKGNFIIGNDRALILAGPVKKDEIGIWTVEKEIVEKLNDEFNQLWAEGTDLED
ncbi:MAG: hypothetical protein QHH19_00610 [Candidatus Thermoplasmatota archaeon]|jgi:hypothetical protein|nr:hypothetical protein [Candidatus Thermoplasmatota archaeon]